MSVIALDKRAKKADDEPAVERQISALYALVKTAVGVLGGVDQGADAMGIDRGDLNRALNRNGRYLTVDHIMRLGNRLRELDLETAQRIAVAFVAPLDLIVAPRTQMTFAEMEDRLLAYIRRFPNGEQAVSDALAPFDPRVQTTAAERVQRLKAYLRRFQLGEQMIRDALATASAGAELVEENRR